MQETLRQAIDSIGDVLHNGELSDWQERVNILEAVQEMLKEKLTEIEEYQAELEEFSEELKERQKQMFKKIMEVDE